MLNPWFHSSNMDAQQMHRERLAKHGGAKKKGDTADLSEGLKLLLKKVVTPGEVNGEVPPYGTRATVHYTGKLKDGTMFDSSVERGQPFQFMLGHGRVIQAWDIGVGTMQKGEICELTCAPEVAYGDKDLGVIPPNSTLIFEIELLGWEPPPIFASYQWVALGICLAILFYIFFISDVDLWKIHPKTPDEL
ncbi:unnamed protein product [Chrysoparadoxa australica]